MARDPRKDPNSIGNILLRLPSVTKEDLERGIEFHKQHSDLFLGEAMVLQGSITRRQLDAAVIEQKKALGQTMALLDYAMGRTRAVSNAAAALTSVAVALKGG